MRDIRQDLRERRDSVRAKREAMESEIVSLKSQEQAYDRLIGEEDALWAKVSPTLFIDENVAAGSILSQVLLDTLKSKSGGASLEELKASAVQRGIPFGDKQPGRVIHFAMLGMAQHKLVERKGDGNWMLVGEAVN
jgi:hypothetical protein